MEARTPRQRAEAISVALRTAPLAALYWWRCVPLEDHDAVCAHLGEFSLRRIMQLDNQYPDQSLFDLRDLIPPELEKDIEHALRRELAAIEKRTSFRVVDS